MRELTIAIFVFSVIENILSYSMPRCEPFVLPLDQALSDITLEIIPYPNYPNCPGQSLPYTTNPYFYLDGGCQCGMYQDCLYEPSLEYMPSFCSNCYNSPFEACPSCSCYRDVRDPCFVLEDPAPLYICFEGCTIDYVPPSPYIYFPQVEYPMSAMDIRPYYYGQCWCN